MLHGGRLRSGGTLLLVALALAAHGEVVLAAAGPRNDVPPQDAGAQRDDAGATLGAAYAIP